MKQYYLLLSDGSQKGPIGEDDIRNDYKNGNLAPQVHAWCEGMESWLTLGEIFGDVTTLQVPPPNLANLHVCHIMRSYYISSQGNRFGPIDEDKLRSAYFRGDYAEETYVWTQGMENWKTLKDEFGVVPPAPEVPNMPPPPPVSVAHSSAPANFNPRNPVSQQTSRIPSSKNKEEPLTPGQKIWFVIWSAFVGLLDISVFMMLVNGELEGGFLAALLGLPVLFILNFAAYNAVLTVYRQSRKFGK